MAQQSTSPLEETSTTSDDTQENHGELTHHAKKTEEGTASGAGKKAQADLSSPPGQAWPRPCGEGAPVPRPLERRARRRGPGPWQLDGRAPRRGPRPRAAGSTCQTTGPPPPRSWIDVPDDGSPAPRTKMYA